MRFNILGPLRVEDPLGEIALPGLKERTLLCVLVARANQVVSVDELIEGLWGDDPPPTAEKSLQAHVVRLRDALEPSRVRGTSGSLIFTVERGYMLRCDPDAVDAHRFEGLAREGHTALSAGAASTATRFIAQALELWRGQPYGDLEAEALDGDRTRLIELERSAREDLAQARLDLGKHRELIPELEQQVVGDPLGERAWAQLMLALYRAGRQSEALDAFHRARTVLAEELGIEPGDDLQRLQRQILDQDPVLLEGIASAPARGLPPELSNGTGPFVGRETELSQLGTLWQRAHDSKDAGVRTVLVVGPDGMGKTRLISEFVRRAASDAVLLYASSNPSTSKATAVFDRMAVAAGRSIAESDETSPAEVGRALGQQIARLTSDDTVIAVLDDLDLSSEEVRSTLGGFATGLESSSGLLVVTSTNGVASRLPNVEVLQLRPLDVADTVAIAAVYSGDDAAVMCASDIAPAARGEPALVHHAAAEWATRQQKAGIRVAARKLAAERATLGQMREDLRARIVGWQTVATISPTADTVAAAPYKGLAPFELDDAAIFFGREQLCGRLVARMAEVPLIVLVGPSGSGKSSLARAGLVAALADGVLPGSESWRLRTVEMARVDCSELEDALDAALADGGADHTLLLVDQLEQLFTTCEHKAHRRAFLDRLAEAAVDPARSVSIIVTLRSDYFGHLADSPAFALAAAEASEVIGPMTAEEIQRAIELPAQRAGVRLESGLAAAIAVDAHGRPGALPLLSTALLELWESRVNGTLTWSAYRRSGGLAGAVARLAEDCFGRLTENEQAVAQRILLRTVGAGDDRREVSRRVPLAELDGEAEIGRKVLTALAERRLMTVDRTAAEVTHEALYQQWPRLRAWLDDDRSGREIQRRLIAAARDWDDRGREDSDLLRGARLIAAVDWADANATYLNDVEREFVAASRAAQERQEELERSRTRSVVRANRRLRFATVGLAALLIVTFVAGAFAVGESGAAERQARAATAARLGATALTVDTLDRELLLAAAAYQADSSLDTRGALLAALTRSPTTTGIIRGQPDERLLDVAVSPDGRLVAIGANAGTIAVWDWQARERVALIQAGQPAFTIAFSSDGGSVYAAQARPDGSHLRRWSAETGVELPHTLVHAQGIENGSIDSVVFAKAAPTAAVFDGEGRVSLVDLDSGDTRVLTTQVTDDNPGTLAISADGRLVAVATEQVVSLVDSTGATAGSFDLESSGIALPITKMAFSPDASQLALAADDGSVHLIDSVAGIEIGRANMHTQTVKDVAFTPDGESIMSVADDGVVARWYPDFGHIERFARGHTGRPFAIAVAPDGQTAFSAAADNVLLEWDLSGKRRFGRILQRLPRGTVWQVSAADGSKVATSYEDGTVAVADLASGTFSQASAGIGLPTSLALSDDGSTLAVAGPEARIAQLDTQTGRPHGEPIVGLSRGITVLSYSPNQEWLAVGDEGSVWLADTTTGSIADKLVDGEMGWSLAWTEDGSRLAIGLGSGDVVVWDVESNSEVTRLDVEDGDVAITSVEWSNDGGTLATGSASGTAQLWSTNDWQPTGRELRAHGSYVIDTRFSQDGKWLATFGGDGAAALWDIEMGRQLGTSFVGSMNEWGGIWMSPNADRLVTYQTDGTIWEWPLDDAAWLERVCDVAGRDLSDDEWATYAPGLEVSPVCPGPAG